MAAIPPFLDALELDTEADERAIRRAYAKRLKRIDQEAEPAAFQALRETFEEALKWAAMQARAGAGRTPLPPIARPPAAAPVAMPPAPVPMPVPVPPVAPPRPNGPPTLRLVRDETPASGGAHETAAMPVQETVPAGVEAPMSAPSPTPPSRPPSAAPLPADTPTLSLLHDAKPRLERRPPPPPLRASAPAAAPARAPDPAPAAAAASTSSTGFPPIVPPPVDAPPPPPPPPTPAPPRPATPALQPALAIVPDVDPSELVFADFVERFNRLADDEPVVARELAAALADPRLVNLEARTAFEGRVANLIMGGWKPGHEFLFKPACEAFDWERDRRRLEIYGPLGAALDAAVSERLMFFGQPPTSFEAQRKLIRRLRTDKPTRPAEIAPSIQMLSMLLQRYPNWMRTMTRQDVVQHWINTWNEFTPEQRQAGTASWQGRTPANNATTAPRMPPPSKPFKPARSSGGFSPFGGVWIVVMVIGALSRLFASSNSSPAYPYQPPSTQRAPELQTPARPYQPDPLPAPSFPAPYTSNFPAQNPPTFGDDEPSTQQMSPAEQARRQRQIDQLAKRQAQIDALNAKRALRDGSGQGAARYDDQAVPVPDPNVGTVPAQ